MSNLRKIYWEKWEHEHKEEDKAMYLKYYKLKADYSAKQRIKHSIEDELDELVQKGIYDDGAGQKAIFALDKAEMNELNAAQKLIDNDIFDTNNNYEDLSVQININNLNRDLTEDDIVDINNYRWTATKRKEAKEHLQRVKSSYRTYKEALLSGDLQRVQEEVDAALYVLDMHIDAMLEAGLITLDDT